MVCWGTHVSLNELHTSKKQNFCEFWALMNLNEASKPSHSRNVTNSPVVYASRKRLHTRNAKKNNFVSFPDSNSLIWFVKVLTQCGIEQFEYIDFSALKLRNREAVLIWTPQKAWWQSILIFRLEVVSSCSNVALQSRRDVSTRENHFKLRVEKTQSLVRHGCWNLCCGEYFDDHQHQALALFFVMLSPSTRLLVWVENSGVFSRRDTINYEKRSATASIAPLSKTRAHAEQCNVGHNWTSDRKSKAVGMDEFAFGVLSQPFLRVITRWVIVLKHDHSVLRFAANLDLSDVLMHG